MKAVEGETDRGGGLVWRAKDKNNYYLCRYNDLDCTDQLFFDRASQVQSAASYPGMQSRIIQKEEPIPSRMAQSRSRRNGSS
jgi:hypothetical protein